MRFIVDESTGEAVVAYLRAAGHDVLAAGEDLAQTDDEVILSRAVEEGRVLITNDKDFGELVFRSGRLHHGVILLRLREDGAGHRVAMLQRVLDQAALRLANSFVVATESGIRVRPLVV